MAAVVLSACDSGERLQAYLDFWQMQPPAKEEPSFEVIGHRGYDEITPENTLAALRRAISESLRIVEVDVRLTADGVPLLLHDESLLHTTGDPRPVSAVPLAEVQRLDAGLYKAVPFAHETVPTLEDA